MKEVKLQARDRGKKSWLCKKKTKSLSHTCLQIMLSDEITNFLTKQLLVNKLNSFNVFINNLLIAKRTFRLKLVPIQHICKTITRLRLCLQNKDF